MDVFSEVTVEGAPVAADGTPDPGASWGRWSAVPGARDVESANFLKIVNTGQRGEATVVIDFTESALTGPDANFTIPLDGNVEFAWCEVSAATAPGDGACDFEYGTASSGSSVTVSFTGRGNVVFVKYRLLELPDVLATQSYAAAFTATEL